MSYNKNNNFKNGEKKDFGKKKNFSPRNRRGDANPGSGKTYNNGESFDEGLSNGSVPGRNAVRELLKSGRQIEKIYVQKGQREGSITVLAATALERGIPLIETEKAKLDKLCGYEPQQRVHYAGSRKSFCGSCRTSRCGKVRKRHRNHKETQRTRSLDICRRGGRDRLYKSRF